MRDEPQKDDLYGTDLTNATWRKSSSSNPENCVEVALISGGVAVRDSKYPHLGALVFNNAEWHAFVRGAGAGEFS